MIKQTLTAVALAGVLAMPAYAQQQKTPAAESMKPAQMQNQQMQQAPGSPMARGADQAGFVQSQDSREWRGSKLIGASVYGPDNTSIGEINDLLIGDNADVKAVVVSVGGFLGIGEKNVAIPYSSLNVTRKDGSASIDKVTVTYSKDELKNAPNFAFYDAKKSQTTGAGANTQPATNNKMINDNKTMKK